MINSTLIKIGGITWALWNLRKKPKELSVLLADKSFLRIASLAGIIWLSIRKREDVYKYKVLAGHDEDEDKFNFMFK